MNNYCTNCGKRLEQNELVCSSCNIPIVKLTEEDQKGSKGLDKNLKSLLHVILVIAGILVTVFLLNVLNGYYLANQYLKPYLKEKSTTKYSYSYAGSGKCIISGNCKFDPLFGCDGGACNRYVYEDNCRAYYYNVTVGGSTRVITIYRKNGSYQVIEGDRVYGGS